MSPHRSSTSVPRSRGARVALPVATLALGLAVGAPAVLAAPGDGAPGVVPEPVVAAVPGAPPDISAATTGAVIPGEILSIVGANFGAEQGQGTVAIDDVVANVGDGWTDGRIDLRVPEFLEAGPATLTLTTVAGTTTAPVTIGAVPAGAPIGNPVAVPAGGANLTFDASAAVDPFTGAGVPGDTVLQAAGLSGIIDILWGFDDGVEAEAIGATRPYTRPGTFNPTVTVATPDGRKSVNPVGTVQIVRDRSGGLQVAAPPPVNFEVPSRVVFDAGSATIRQESRSYLLKLSKLVKAIGRRTEIGGHTDNTGPSASFSQKLSLQRARAVRTFLITEGGVPEGLLTAVGFGAAKPIADNGTPLGRQRNRRVTLSIPRGGSPIRLTSEQLKINQRIAQVAVARAQALEKHLTGGLDSGDIRDGSITPQDFGPSVAVSGAPALATPDPGVTTKIQARQPKQSSARLQVSKAQLRINQRITQGAMRRANRLAAVIDDGLTGAAIKDGALTPADVAPGIDASQATGVPNPPRFVLPALDVPKVKVSNVRATQQQLIINQRVSQATIRRLNVLIARVERGFSGSDFRDGTLTSADLAG